MKTILLLIALIFSTLLQAQNSVGTSYIKFQVFGQGLAVGSHPDAEIGIDYYDTHAPQMQYTDAYLHEYSNDSSCHHNQWSEWLISCIYPGSQVEGDTVEYITNISMRFPYNTNIYPRFMHHWDTQYAGTNDYYFRTSLDSAWQYLNPLFGLIDTTDLSGQDVDPWAYDLIDPLLTMEDSIDPNEDDLFFAGQIKVIVYPFADTTTTDTTALSIGVSKRAELGVKYTQQSIQFTAPNDSYNVSLYDMSGKLLFTRRYYGENFEVPINDLNVGLYIYFLEGKETYTGKFLKN